MLELKWEFKGGKCVQVRWVKTQTSSERAESSELVEESKESESLKAS